MRDLKQSTAYNLMVLMVDSTDHVTGKAGLTLAISASKAGGAFASITPTVTERSGGWYSLALTASHTDTLGDLVVRCTATGADPSDVPCQVRGAILGDTFTANLAPDQVVGIAAGAIASASFAAGATLPRVTLADTTTDLTGKAGFKLASDGLDAIAATEPTVAANGAMSTWKFPQLVRWLVMRFANAAKTPTTLTVKTLAGATSTTQSLADDGVGNESTGAPS